MLNEGIHDPAAMKFVFLAGAPGTGKSRVAKELFAMDPKTNMTPSGMKYVNLDLIFEKLLEKKGYSKDMTNLTPEEEWEITSIENPKSLFQTARAIMKKQMAEYAKAGLGIIYDGTGQNPESYINRKYEMEELGYDTYCIGVYADLETALARNAKRDRKLPEELVKDIYKKMKRSFKTLYRTFGKDRMFFVRNNDGDNVPKTVQTALDKIISGPIKNKRGQYWLANKGKRMPKPKPKYSSPGPKYLPGEKQGNFFKHGSPTHMAPKTPKPDYYHAKKDGSGHVNFQKPWQNTFSAKYDPSTDSWDSWMHQKPHTSPMTAPDTLHGKKHEPPVTKATDQIASGDPDIPKFVDLMNTRIRNDQTGNDILFTTALGYPPDHPARKAAERLKTRQQQGKV